MGTGYAALLTSCADRQSAKALAKTLVEQRLAACVQMLPIESVYEWQGKIEEATEILLICKIKRADYDAAENAILSLHAYETPEIVLLPIEAGSAAYLAWMEETTRK